jgi:hypothetical protein
LPNPFPIYKANNLSSNVFFSSYPEEVGSKLLRNVCNKLPINTASYTISL